MPSSLIKKENVFAAVMRDEQTLRDILLLYRAAATLFAMLELVFDNENLVVKTNLPARNVANFRSWLS